jgi:hypothetical protein
MPPEVSLAYVTARILAELAVAAFDCGDRQALVGAVAALVELQVSAARRRG